MESGGHGKPQGLYSFEFSQRALTKPQSLPRQSEAQINLTRSWAKLWWRGLHFACLLLSSLLSAFSRIKLTIPLFLSNENLENFLVKWPQAVAVVLESEEAKTRSGKVLELIQFLAEIGVQHVSLYDMEGALKSCMASFEDSLNKKIGTRLKIRCYSHKLVFPINHDCESLTLCATNGDQEILESRWNNTSCCDNVDVCDLKRPGQLTVEFLSLNDGKEMIVQAARLLCLKSIQSDDPKKLSEDDINRNLREIGVAGPDPDLLLLFSSTRCLLGFPPWRLRLTEIVHMGLIKSITKHSFVAALKEFSKKTHRYGK